MLGSLHEMRVVDPNTGGEKGQKLARFDLIPTDALRQVAEHYGIGASKYADRNWERGYDWGLSYAALCRHLNAFWGGEDIDEETGSPHLAAVVFHALALMTYSSNGLGTDSRSKITESHDHAIEKIGALWADEIALAREDAGVEAPAWKGLRALDFPAPALTGTAAGIADEHARTTRFVGTKWVFEEEPPLYAVAEWDAQEQRWIDRVEGSDERVD